MQKIFLSLLVSFALATPTKSQNSFSFNCRKDTTIECTTQCLTIKTVIPDIYSSTNSYVVDKISARNCFRGYVSPAISGPSSNLTIDDRYSPTIDIGFPFSFYGNSYTKLIASTNGYVSFDTAKKLTFSHFGILKNGNSLSSTNGIPEDLPSSLYDNALIMGPYHDLDPNNSTSTQQIKYDVIGTAPFRMWILSYYNVPLYTTACLNLNQNTHQIVLYETLGIVEVYIYDKEICLNWNKGRSIIGMQDFTKIRSIMAPGRSANSTPWGNVGINESWRFVPASGQSLFKRVELYTISGSLVTTGVTANIGNNQLEVSFNNVCPPSSGETYLVKSFYRKPNDTNAEMISVDTIHISRGDPVLVSITPTICVSGSKGDINITSPVGAVYEYSIDGLNWQTSTIFTVPVGKYTLKVRVIGSNCISSKEVFMYQDPFDASIITTITPCPEPLSASIKIFPRNGTPPYSFSLDGGPFQSTNIYSGLLKGSYPLLITDAAGCLYTTVINIALGNLATASVTNTICGKPGTGGIIVTPGYGFAPYSYSLNGAAFQSSNTFNNLAVGTYKIDIKDSVGCLYSFDETVAADVVLNVTPLIKLPSCFGDTNGSFTVRPSLGASPYLFALDGKPYQTDSVFINLPAGNYNLSIKDSLGCIKDTIIIIQQPNELRVTSILTPASTCFLNDGQITIKANGGTTPYEYSINNETTFQSSTVFNVVAGLYTIIVKDTNGCKTKHIARLDAVNNKMQVNAGEDKTVCIGSSTTLSIQSAPLANDIRWTSNAGLSDSTSPTPVATPLDTTMYIVTARSAVCEGTDTVIVNVLHKPIADAGRDTIICYNTNAILRGSATNTSGSVSYLWEPATDILSATSATTIVRPRSTRSHTYRLQVTDNYGCNFKVYDHVRVFMNEPLIASAGYDTVASIGAPHQLYGSGGTDYLWSPANVLNNPNLQNPLAILQNDTRFNLTVTDTLGCIGTSSVLIKVYKGVTYYIPNAFTPNNDGINDVFKGVAPGIQRTNYFRIYNRLGQLVFENQDINKGWDGRFLGVPQPTAVYVWVIKGVDKSGKTVELKGTVTLIR